MTSGDGYPLDLASVVSHVAATLDGAAPAALSVRELASTYRHPNTGDLARVREHEGAATNDEAVEWLISRAISELRYRKGPTSRRQIEYTDGAYRLADGLVLADLRWRGTPVYAVRNVHALLGDPFNPMSGFFADNIRRGKPAPSKLLDDELRESMRGGWLPGHPAVIDERGVVITGHRRLAIAKELGIDSVTETVTFGEGDAGDIQRLRTAFHSNRGTKEFSPTDRAEIAKYLTERGWKQATIAEALSVAQQTISRDLDGFTPVSKPPRPKGGRPRGTVRPSHPKAPDIREAVRPFVEVDRPVPQKKLAEDYGVSATTVQRFASEERVRVEAQRETAAALSAADDEGPAAETEPAERCSCTCCPH